MPIRTIVFDAYGTLFDVAGAARTAAADTPILADIWPRLADDWRRKQLEYSWLRTIMRQHADFATVTADALDWALAAQGIDDIALRTRLLALYDRLPAYPEVPQILAALQARGLARAILSNGTEAMLDSAITSAGLQGSFDAVLSVEAVAIYKPSQLVYDLVMERFLARPDEVLFVSSNGWDIAGAGTAGFRTLWVNRTRQPVDRLPTRPDHVAADLTTITDHLA